ncbi:MAG: creatininase family protein [Cyclobacteriaceae bacterium]|nr:creatininase family protein [Cyclobacteriaceae bacterium]
MSAKIRPYVLKETNWKAAKETRYQVAVLPWGATEAHNYHMPYGTDCYEAESMANTSAGIAWEKGAKVVALPVIPFGVNTGQMDVNLCMNMNPSTQMAILRDVVQVLEAHNVPKLVILNSHGGNNFKQMIRELSIEYPEVFVCSIDWWKALPQNDYFDEPGDHAGELETSVMLHLTPELMLPLEVAGDGAARQFKLAGFKEGWVTAQRAWTSVTKDTGVGNPAKSTAEKGKAYFEACTTKIGAFLADLAVLDNDDMYV